MKVPLPEMTAGPALPEMIAARALPEMTLRRPPAGRRWWADESAMEAADSRQGRRDQHRRWPNRGRKSQIDIGAS
jgi:hypothetical protein